LGRKEDEEVRKRKRKRKTKASGGECANGEDERVEGEKVLVRTCHRVGNILKNTKRG